MTHTIVKQNSRYKNLATARKWTKCQNVTFYWITNC